MTRIGVRTSAAVRAAAKRILDQSGYKVLETSTGKAALALAAKKLHEIHSLTEILDRSSRTSLNGERK